MRIANCDSKAWIGKALSNLYFDFHIPSQYILIFLKKWEGLAYSLIADRQNDACLLNDIVIRNQNFKPPSLCKRQFDFNHSLSLLNTKQSLYFTDITCKKTPTDVSKLIKIEAKEMNFHEWTCSRKITSEVWMCFVFAWILNWDLNRIAK